MPRLKELNISLLASGVAFWAMLSLFPSLLALIALYGLIADPQEVTDQVGNLLGALSPEANQVITKQLTEIASGNEQALGIGLAVSVALLLWSASSGMQNLMQAITTAYEQKETRGFIKLRATALALTLGGILFSIIALVAIGVVPALIDRFVPDGPLKIVAYVGEAVVLFALIVSVLMVLYRYAPANRPTGLRWASPGAVIAAVLWLIGSIGFAVYVHMSDSYANTYGALAGVIIFMLWLYLTSFAVLLGALINAEAERGMKGNAPSEPEGVNRDIVRGPDEEKEDAVLQPPTDKTVDLRDPSDTAGEAPAEGKAGHRRG
jgi:membrane protein